MRTRTLFVTFAASAMAVVPTAAAVEGAPLPRRDGVVVAWQARTSTAFVVTGDQRVYAIHTLRRVAPGTRVRVEGIKWGTPTSGIKWSVAPGGIKWGIKKAKNGTFSSRLTKLPGVARTMSLRGTVGKRYGGRGVAIGLRGGTVIIPFRGAVWLPGAKRNNGVDELGLFGAKVTVTVRLDARGRTFSNRVVETAPPTPMAAVPVSGRVTAVDTVARTLTVQAGTTPFPLLLTITVPPTADLALYPVGSEVTAMVVQATPPDTTLAAVELSLNKTFAQADSPLTSLAVPPPNPVHVAAAEAMQSRWVVGRTQNLIPNTGIFTAEQNRLDRIEFLIVVGDKVKAVMELDQFDRKIRDATPDRIDTAFRDEMLAAAAALKAQLLAG